MTVTSTFEVPYILLGAFRCSTTTKKELFEYERALAVIGTRRQHALCIIKTSFGSSADS
jgi:hypothetical protein